MRRTRNVIGLGILLLLAFAVGRWSPSLAVESAAAQDTATDPQLSPEMMEEIEAWKKAGTPGEHHKHLDVLIGDWDAKVTFWMEPGGDPFEAEATVTRKWVLGNRFVQEQVEGQSFGGEVFNAIGYAGYNNIDGQFEFAWMDTHSTAIYLVTGWYNPDTKTLTTHGSFRDPLTGRVLPARDEIDLSDPDRHRWVSYIVEDGREYKHGEGVMTRREE